MMLKNSSAGFGITSSLTLGTFLDSFRSRRRWSGFSYKETMLVDKHSAMLPLLALGALGVVNVVVAIGAWRHASTAEELGEGASSYCVIRSSDPRCCARSAGC
jgi:hypothetical protein